VSNIKATGAVELRRPGRIRATSRVLLFRSRRAWSRGGASKMESIESRRRQPRAGELLELSNRTRRLNVQASSRSIGSRRDADLAAPAFERFAPNGASSSAATSAAIIRRGVWQTFFAEQSRDSALRGPSTGADLHGVRPVRRVSTVQLRSHEYRRLDFRMRGFVDCTSAGRSATSRSHRKPWARGRAIDPVRAANAFTGTTSRRGTSWACSL